MLLTKSLVFLVFSQILGKSFLELSRIKHLDIPAGVINIGYGSLFDVKEIDRANPHIVRDGALFVKRSTDCLRAGHES